MQIRIGGRKTGLAIEHPFRAALKDIAAAQGTSMSRLIAKIDSERQNANRSSAVRLFVLDYYRSRAAEFTEEQLKTGVPNLSCRLSGRAMPRVA
jgi:predicted DNA-binding ribbon-helix-helix protein